MVSEITKLHKANCSSAIPQNVLLQNNDVAMTTKAIINYINSEKDETSKTKTDAEGLLKILQDQTNITYFAMYAESSSTPLFTVNMPKRAKKEIKLNIKLHGYVRVHPHEETILEPQIDSLTQAILKKLIVKNSRTHKVKVLLAVGWARDEDILILRKFPEVIKLDSTFKTNCEGRPLFNMVCKDSNNQLYTVMRCLLPSERLGVFDIILASFIPKLFGELTCSKVQVVITDGDSQEIKACQKSCKTVFVNAHHVNCLWHLINRSLLSSKVIHHPRLKEVISRWLTFTAYKCETMDEHNQSLNYLKVCFIFGQIISYSHNNSMI
jgi:hypothetical protein